MSSLTESIEREIQQSGAEVVGVAAFDLESSREILVNPDVSFHPASTFKVCVMMEVFHQAQQGLFSLEDKLPIKNTFHSIVDGSEYSLSIVDDSEPELYTFIGRELPIHDVVTRVITRSSNLGTNILLEFVTPEKVNELIRSLGVKDILVRRGVEDNKAFAKGMNNAATARSLMQILTRLAKRDVVSQDASESMITIMKQQHYNEGIPALLPIEVSIAHKTGWNGKLYHDVAIIYPPNTAPYVSVIMTQGLSDDKEAPMLVSTLSKMIYDHLSK